MHRKRTRLLIVSVISVASVDAFAGCAAGDGRAGTVDHNRVEASVDVDVEARLTAALAVVEELEVKLAEIKVGGGGDSVTAWLYAAIAAAAIFYPVVVRPVRKRCFKKRDPHADGPQRPAQDDPADAAASS